VGSNLHSLSVYTYGNEDLLIFVTNRMSMTSFNNGDLYEICLNRLRKDKKGAISPEEFESFLRLRNIDYFNQQMGGESGTKINHDSLTPFMVFQNDIAVTTANGEHYVILNHSYVGPSPDSAVAHLINVWWIGEDVTDFSTKIPVDVLSNSEWGERFSNAITGPTSAYPVACRGSVVLPVYGNSDALWCEGGTDITSGSIVIDYYTYPADPYFDYYVDSSGNITYLTDGQVAYTLLTGEVARDGSTAGEAVTSASEDLQWDDQDAMNILDMVMTDIYVAQSDQSGVEASVLERQQNVKS